MIYFYFAMDLLLSAVFSELVVTLHCDVQASHCGGFLIAELGPRPHEPVQLQPQTLRK